MRAADFDADGDLDLYVANDSDANYLYRNEGGGSFKETGLWSGAAFDVNGAAQAGMGIATGDVNRDLVPDLVVTNFSEDFTTLYIGEGKGFFRDASDSSRVGAATFLSLSWGTVLADLDNDGDEDLVIANGHIYPQVDQHPEFGMIYAQRDQLLENLGDGTFKDVTDRAGPGFALARSSRGVAAGDYDNDGDVDLLITALDGPPALLRNESTVGSWLTVVCDVPSGHGGAIGTRVEVVVGDRRMARDVSSGGSFLSVHDRRLHFGLGSADAVEQVRSALARRDDARRVRRERQSVPGGRQAALSDENRRGVAGQVLEALVSWVNWAAWGRQSSSYINRKGRRHGTVRFCEGRRRETLRW